ncbi:hypothetical protein [Candidatus Protochlamydia phocaeensis]|uniref:hypothetical protein n=1 Tax=Candidatus Protochlamydia phocaeensis TaxID=1414722 RepID=UPI0008390E5C|nr:hypothetical protein [Candidatus Protochlamydia phocaeensis]
MPLPISDSTLSPSHPVISSDAPALEQPHKQVEIKNGQLILPNGGSYQVSKLVIGGKQVDLTKGLSESQLKAIQTFTNQLFKQLNELNLKSRDLQTLTFKAKQENMAEVTAKYSQESKTQAVNVKPFQSQLETIKQQFGSAVQKTEREESLSTEGPPPSSLLHEPTPDKANRIGVPVIKAERTEEEEGEEDISLPYEIVVTGLPENPSLPHSHLIGEKDPTQSSQISHAYEIDGKVIAEQTITRTNTIDQDILFCQKMIKHLTAKLEESNPPLTEPERQKVQNDLDYYEQAMQRAQNYRTQGKDWIGSNGFRDLIAHSLSFNDAARAYISAPVNMRYQELDIEGERKVGFYRIGIMSDMRNGWVSLTDLKAMKDQPEKVQAKIKEIQEYILHPKGKSTPLSGNKLESALHALYELQTIANHPAYLDKVIEERRRAIEQQMIQLIEGQISQNPDKALEALNAGRTFDLVHVSLLNQNKVDLDKTGWMHNERVEMEDMKEIFDDFKGKKLVFDGKGPFIDGDTIHLSHQFEGQGMGTKEVALNTFFFNISVQGNVQNKGAQLSINTEQLNHLLEAHPHILDQYPEIKEAILKGKETGYDLAEDFLFALLQDKSLCASLGCLSAKDRTGFISERLMLRMMQPHLPNPKGRNPFEKDIFKPDSPAVKVVSENTPHYQILKVNPTSKLRGYNIWNKLGIATDLFFAEVTQKGSQKKIKAKPLTQTLPLVKKAF